MKKVLVLTHENDPHATEICNYFDIQGVGYFRVNTDLLPTKYLVSFRSSNLESRISDGHTEIVLDESWNIWNRRVTKPNLSLDKPSELKKIIEDETKNMWIGIIETHNGRVVSTPSSIYAASNKIHQLSLARNLGQGIIVPNTLVSNDPELVKQFYEEQGKDICMKLQKGQVLDIGGEKYTIYTNKIELHHMQQVSLVRESPHLFQKYYNKDYEVRVITIGTESIGVAIHSQEAEISKVDFRRYDFENVPYTSIELPDNVSEFCSKMLGKYGLEFGAFDFIVTKEGEYIFLELNPNGQWFWLEQLSGVKISVELGNYLSK